MCGICGYISKTQYSERLLSEMNDTMYHRGPDDSGIFQGRWEDGAQVGLAQRRLSVLDLSPAGHQPMFNQSGDIGIVYNGEVYNFKELRRGLEEKGYHFRSSCDTEVILYLYQEYGVGAFAKMNGMFALAIMDARTKELVLARDRIGKKPLYYYIGPGETFVFASELKPILKFPEFHKEIRGELISRYLCYKFIHSPDTIFKDTYKVEPGQYLIWKKGGIFKSVYWDLLKQYEDGKKIQQMDYVEAKKRLRELLYDSVEKRLAADVPVGAFLSGGIDSSLITAIASDILKKPVRTFTIGFTSKDQDEAGYAREVARYLGTKHTELYITEKELLAQLKDLVRYYDEPFSDSSQIPTMLVSQLARQETTVTLAGDGGDELFCGYEMYDWVLLAQKMDWAGKIGYGVLNLPAISNVAPIGRFPDKARAFFCNRDPIYKTQLFTDVREKYSLEMVEGTSQPAKYDYERDIVNTNVCTDNWQMRRMLLDMKYSLPDDILVKMDRASMRYSLEVRCPLLDFRVIEYSFQIPHEFKYYKKDKKHILKDIAYELVPREMLDRPKRGFGVPLAKWLRNELHDSLLRYTDADILKRQGIFNPGIVGEFVRKLDKSDVSLYNSILWSFYVFQLWYQEYVEDLWGV